jgi:phosphoadenosine phosphosulfate reductase
VRVEVFDAQRPADGAWNASACCSERKVAALELALDGLDGWITGLRREQSPTRAQAPKLAFDERRGIWKANPLADWDAKAVWEYIAANDVPYNPLHDRGYESIGCMPCTLPGSGREGRWAGSDKTECGIHV